MGKTEFEQLVESTWGIRHEPAWVGARQALLAVGVDPDRAICTYFGGWGKNGCAFALPDGRLLLLEILLGWDGRYFVPADEIEEEFPLEPSEKLALSLAVSGDTGKFDARVRERFQQATAELDGAGETETAQ